MPKENLVIIHGWRDSSNSYQSVIELINQDFNVIRALDLPGFKTPLPRPYTFEDFIQFIEENTKQLDNFYLLGHSFGGALAMLFAIKHPQKVKKLILYNPAIVRSTSKKIKVKILRTLARIVKKVEKIFPQKIALFIKKIIYRFIVRSYDYFNVDDNLKKTMKNIYQDLSEKAKEVSVPTIMLWGVYDKITPLKEGKLLQQLIKNSQLIVFEGGHSYHKKDPEKFAKILKEALNI
ncbi:MAG: hypothetical protein KatS3mg097_399 [Candidatus Parcubacteria bacterium]|nr:MAG: hypothetical protein KatS3mg097_399 [Candidatus Parcubacteria bacterium]